MNLKTFFEKFDQLAEAPTPEKWDIQIAAGRAALKAQLQEALTGSTQEGCQSLCRKGCRASM
jgi:hypothetical protein